MQGKQISPINASLWACTPQAGQGNDWIHNAFDWVTSNFVVDFLTPRGSSAMARNMIGGSQRAFRSMLSGTPVCRSAWSEWINKTLAFQSFASANELIRRYQGASLPELLQATFGLPSFNRLWLTEGVGYFWGHQMLREQERGGTRCFGSERGGPLLGESVLQQIPESCHFPVHTGLGLALARRQLRRLGVAMGAGFESRVHTMLQDFHRLCRENVSPTLVNSSFEAMGMITRILRPSMVAMMDRALSSQSELARYFWHGVGRGIYFSPGNVPPFNRLGVSATARAYDEPPHELGRANAAAGLGWATALINIQNLPVVEDPHRRPPPEPRYADAFTQGAEAASRLWNQWCDDQRYTRRTQRSNHRSQSSSCPSGDRNRPRTSTAQFSIVRVLPENRGSLLPCSGPPCRASRTGTLASNVFQKGEGS